MTAGAHEGRSSVIALCENGFCIGGSVADDVAEALRSKAGGS